MRDEYFQAALKVIEDPYILINVVSQRVKQLNRGHRALVESLEKLSPTDLALREIAEGRIRFDMPPRPASVAGPATLPFSRSSSSSSALPPAAPAIGP